jgi:hypothetical protein
MGADRHYRRLLWAYPRAYRAGHGDEIVTTLLDMTAAGRGRPGPAQLLHLVLCGLRQRFRLPAGRPLAWVAALLAAVALGAFGSAAGTWLGWQAAADLPSDHELRALNAAITGMPVDAAVYREASAMKGPDVFLRADGVATFSADRVRTALSAAGWHLTSFTESPGVILVGVPAPERLKIPTANVDYEATKGDLKLVGDGSVISGAAGFTATVRASYATRVWPQEPAVVRPLTVAGILAGALAGWWLAAAFAYRVRRSGRLRGAAATASVTAGFLAAALPVHHYYRDAYQVLVYAQGSPYPYIVNGPADSLLVLAGTVVGLVAVAAAFFASAAGRSDAQVRVDVAPLQ